MTVGVGRSQAQSAKPQLEPCCSCWLGGQRCVRKAQKALRSSCSRLRHARKHRLLLRLGAGSAAGNLPVVQHSSAVVAMLPVSLGQTGCAAGGGRAPRA